MWNKLCEFPCEGDIDQQEECSSVRRMNEMTITSNWMHWSNLYSIPHMSRIILANPMLMRHNAATTIPQHEITTSHGWLSSFKDGLWLDKTAFPTSMSTSQPDTLQQTVDGGQRKSDFRYLIFHICFKCVCKISKLVSTYNTKNIPRRMQHRTKSTNGPESKRILKRHCK